MDQSSSPQGMHLSKEAHMAIGIFLVVSGK